MPKHDRFRHTDMGIGTLVMPTPVTGWRLRFTYYQLLLVTIVQFLALGAFYIGVADRLEAVAQRTTAFSSQRHSVTQDEFTYWKLQLTNRMSMIESKIGR